MDLDLKFISAALGIASSVVAIAYKLKSNPAARLKRDLELLKLARETKTNYFALQRHVDTQITNAYVMRGLDLRMRLELYYGELFFSVLFGVMTFGFLGSLLALGAKALFSVQDSTAGATILVAGGVGLFGGISHGSKEGANRVGDALREAETRAKELVETDESAIRAIRQRDA